MRLGDVLDEARRRTFVGRDAELTSFDDALLGRSARRVFLLHGVGGIGTSTLLGEFRALAAGRGRPWPARSTSSDPGWVRCPGSR